MYKMILFLSSFHFFNYVSEKGTDPNFIAQFPYDEYIATNTYTSLDTLVAHTALVKLQGHDSEAFLDQLFLHHQQQTSFDFSKHQEVEEQISLGIALLQHDSMALQIQGDQLLQFISSTIETGLQNEKIENENLFWIAQLKRLEQEQFIIDVPVKDREKLVSYLQQGRFGYIFKRFQSRCIVDCSNGNFSTLCSLFWFCILGSITGLLFLLYAKQKKKLLQSRLH